MTEDGYSRCWSTKWDEEARTIVAYSDGSSDFSEQGDGEYLECTLCGAKQDVPEGTDIDWR